MTKLWYCRAPGGSRPLVHGVATLCHDAVLFSTHWAFIYPFAEGLVEVCQEHSLFSLLWKRQQEALLEESGPQKLQSHVLHLEETMSSVTSGIKELVQMQRQSLKDKPQSQVAAPSAHCKAGPTPQTSRPSATCRGRGVSAAGSVSGSCGSPGGSGEFHCRGLRQPFVGDGGGRSRRRCWIVWQFLKIPCLRPWAN